MAIHASMLPVMTLTAPSPPADWDPEREYRIFKLPQPCETVAVEPVGSAFMGVARRHVHKRTLEEDLAIEEALLEVEAEDSEMEEDEPETPALLRSDPLKWKTQDHYAILGLSKKRWRATDEQIKRAYRKKVLKHHPDKKAAKKGKINDDSFFKCIQKAWEILGDPVKRRQWDSIDPKFDDVYKNVKKGDFFDVFSEAVEREGRFSKRQPVPPLGTIDATREEIEAFYEFWRNFDSWRTFEMLDEDDIENCESREEKRMLERRNRSARAKRKKEDNARLQKFVDQMLKADPRISKIREEEKAAKEAKKREKEEAIRLAQEEIRKKEEEERKLREAEEALEKQRLEVEKKDREAKKKLIRKEKKTIRGLIKDRNYFLPSSASVSDLDAQLQKVDNLLDLMAFEDLETFRKNLEFRSAGPSSAAEELFDKELERFLNIVAKKKEEADSAKALQDKEYQLDQERKALLKQKLPWSPKEIAILIKAVKMFPGGTINRWETIAEYVNLHGGEDDETEATRQYRQRSSDDCIKKSKEIQLGGAGDRNRLQATQIKKHTADVADSPTKMERENQQPEAGGNPAKANGDATTTKDTVAQQPPTVSTPPAKAAPANTSTAAGAVATAAVAEWSALQQTALEEALRKFSASMFKENPADRWDKIAEFVPGKSKKDVKLRVKELADMVKKKKTAA
ncbi:hypothetical protein BJ742DRAFT_775504 [Cladochytrium replicatum]|nr:hypothetical protein BJ742DRAFT_775504 [Cladochytrium replicatum]